LEAAAAKTAELGGAEDVQEGLEGDEGLQVLS